MTKFLGAIFTSISLCLACSGNESFEVRDEFAPADAGAQIGSASQALYMPTGYGMEKTGGRNICDSEWSGGECFVPENKTVIVGFMAATCSSWWQARFVEVWNELEDSLLPQTNWYLLPPQDIGFGQTLANYQMYCNSDSKAAFGAFKPYIGNGTTTDHATDRGTLREYHQGELYVGAWPIETSDLWKNASNTVRKRFGRSLIKHEMAHLFGHGHNPGHALMDGANSPNWYSTELTWDAAMIEAMTEYNPVDDALFPDYCEDGECDGVP